METMHWIRDILEQGADWFSARGRHGCQGLRSFSVSGRVKQPGVYLTDAGITVRELIDEYCGGMLAGHEFYAYFPAVPQAVSCRPPWVIFHLILVP